MERGRPKKQPTIETKDKKISLSMTPTFHAIIKEDADAEGMTFNGFVSYVLRQWHNKHYRKKVTDNSHCKSASDTEN